MNPKHIFQLVFLLFILISFSPNSVGAQEPTPELEPQKVIAIGESQCGGQVNQMTLEVWNVGAAGGDAYAQAVYYTQMCANDEWVDFEPSYGTFSGGPNGVATLTICLDDDACAIATLEFIDGKEVKYVEEDRIAFIVQNPEAFIAATPTLHNPGEIVHQFRK